MAKPASPNIYFHVGTGKTGTTFLQYRVFPKLKGLQYIQRTNYHRAGELIRASKAGTILLSREFDQQLEAEVTAFASQFPHAIPIIVFRRHDSYIASQYRRFVKNGFRGSFTEFFDLDADKGYFKQADLNYSDQVELLRRTFKGEPIVLNYDDLSSDPHDFVQRLADLLGAEIDLDAVDFSAKHTSYSERQLKWMLRVNRMIDMTKWRHIRGNPLHTVGRFLFEGFRYLMLFKGRFMPNAFLVKGPLIAKPELDRVRDAYSADWEKIQNT